MSSVDQRVVDMQFNNRQFESGVQTSIKSLNDLKKGLDLEGSAKGLSALDKAGKSFSLAGIAEGVETIASRFTTLGIVGVTALANITNSAVNAGKRMVSALTVDPIMKGFEEYETKMGAIQTILTNTASKGTTLNDVNKALEELNAYADQTIYNFSEMTKNIGTFTAAGVDLKTSTTSIKGIANLAAGSGSSALQASTAMYQLSQAIAAGSVKLQDWNSVVNAGMGGELFQKALEKTAKELGKGRDMSKSFRESLESGWITTKVLTKTLEKFANDKSLIQAATQVKTFTQLFDTMKESVQSGWAVSWENIVGNKEDSAKMLTNISEAFNNLIGPSTDARNEMLKFWNANGGRTALIESFSNAFKGLQSVLKPIGDAFREVFPAITGKNLVDFSNKLKELTSHFKIGEATAYNLKAIFKGLFSTIHIGVETISTLVSGAAKLISIFVPAGGHLLGFAGAVGTFATGLDESITKTDAFGQALKNIGEYFKKVGSDIKKTIIDIGNGFVNLGKYLHIPEIMASTFATLQKVFNGIKTGASNAFDGFGFDSVLKLVNGGLLAGAIIGIKKLVDLIRNFMENGPSFLENITGVLDGVKGSLSEWQNQLKSNTLIKISTAILMLAAGLVALSMIDTVKLGTALAAMTGLFIDLFASMAIFEKTMGSSGFQSLGKATTAMIGLSVAVLILSSAMTKLAKLDWGGVARGLTALTVMMGELIGASILMANNSGNMAKGAFGLILFSTSIIVMANAIKILGAIDAGGLVQGLTSLAAILTVLVTFLRLTGDVKHVISTAIGLNILASAMIIFAKAVQVFGGMSWEQIGKGLAGMAGALLLIAGAMRLMPNNMIGTGAALLIISTSLVILSKALSNMGGMSWDTIAKGLITLAGSLTIIAVSMAFMTSALPGAAALVVIAGALSLLTPILVVLGALPLTNIGVGLLALAGTFLVIGVTSAVLGPLIPVILGLSAGIALLGVGCLAAGAGLLAFSMGFTALAAAGAAGGVAIGLVIKGLLDLIPLMLKKIGEGIVEFGKVIANSATTIAKSMSAVVMAMVNEITTTIPAIVTAVIKLVTTLLNTLVQHVPQLMDAGIKLIIAFLKGLSENIGKVVETAIDIVANFIKAVAEKLPRVIQAGVDLIVSFINGLANAIRNNTDTMISAVKNLMDAIISAAKKVLISSISGFTTLGKNLIEGLWEGFSSMTTWIGEKVRGFAKGVIDNFKSFWGIHSPSRVMAELGGHLVNGLSEGIDKKKDKPAEALKKMSENIKKYLQEALGDLSVFAEKNKLNSEMWGLTDGKTATEIEKLQHQLSDLTNQQTEQKNVISSVEMAYNRMVKLYGANHIESIKLENQILKEKVAYEKLGQEIENINSIINNKPFDESLKWIEERKNASELGLQEELAAWERVQARYIEGSKERIRADKEVARVQKELGKSAFDDSMEWIDERKYYNELALSDELAAWKRVQARYIKGTDERKKADREVYRLQNEINKMREDYSSQVERIHEERNNNRKQLEDDYYAKTKEVNEKLKQDIKQVNEEYTNAVDSRAKSLYNSYGLFDKVDKKDKVKGSDLMKNLQDQVNEFDNWQSTLNQLSAKGVNDALIKEFQEMGPKSIAQVEALNSMTSSELAQYVSLWAKKHQEAKDQAKNELEDLRIETRHKISELRDQSEQDLNEYKNVWKKQMSELNKNTNKQLNDLRKDFNTKIGSLRVDTETEFKTLTQNVQTTVNDADWKEVGGNIITGINQGVKEETPSLLQNLVDVAMNALQVVKDQLGIKSPSRAFAEIGMYMNQGMAVGLQKYGGVVTDATKVIATDAISSMSRAISGISDVINTDSDYMPTIRPVLDLSNVTSGVKQIDGVMSANRTMTLGAKINQNNQNGGKTPTEELAETTVQSNSKIVDAIESLKEDFATLVDKFGNLQVIMDTGTLVGAISPEMDKSLGQRSVFKRRGI